MSDFDDDATLLGDRQLPDAPSARPSGGDSTDLADGASPIQPEAEELAQGDAVGRYVVLTRLGAGGMGVVYAAYDPELDRKVALKLLRNWEASETARLRLLREAQALARLSHPNVVAVHDAGVYGDRVFVAMEYVVGQTLRDWAREQKRDWLEVFDVMMAAGRGLLAAHEQGLIHRDFKPDNVMVGDDGRVRVMDFGLARRSSDSVEEVRDDEAQPTSVDLSTPLTAAGATPGTPAYMSYEQWSGAAVGPAADQFAYCATFWECVHGQRPYSGTHPAELLGAVEEERIDEPKERSTPEWLASVLRKGLRRDANERHPDMAALLGTLERRRRSAAGRPLRIGLAALATVGVALVGWRWAASARAAADCRTQGESLAEVYGDAQRQQIRTAFAEHNPDYGPRAADLALAGLDSWVETWSQVRERSCLDADAPTSAKTDACLEQRRHELEALVSALPDFSRELIYDVTGQVSGLARPADCVDAGHLERLPALDRQELQQLDEVRTLISETTSLWLTARIPEAVEHAEQATARARALGIEAAIAEAQLSLGRMLEVDGQYTAAADALTDAYARAAQQDLPDTIAAAALELTELYAIELGRVDVAEAWGHATEAALARLDDPKRLGVAELRTAQFAAAYQLGDAERGQSYLEEAYEILEAEYGRDHPETMRVLANMGIFAVEHGDPIEGLAQMRSAAEAYERFFGPRFPELAVLYNQLTLAAHATAQPELANEFAHKCLALADSDEAPSSDVATCIASLGVIAMDEGRPKDAVAHLERSRTIIEAELGAEHQHMAVLSQRLCLVYERMSDLEAAARECRRGYELSRSLYEEDDVDLALATALHARHVVARDHDQARELVSSAVSVAERSDSPEMLAMVLVAAAEIERRGGDLRTAAVHAERVLALEFDDEIVAALAVFELAQARLELEGADVTDERRTMIEAPVRKLLAEHGPTPPWPGPLMQAWLDRM